MHRSPALLAASAASIAGLVAFLLLRTKDDQITEDSIVMLGDSITAEGEWDALLPDQPLVNEGHPGFTTAELIDVAARIGDAEPAAVIALTGTNDIRDGHPATWTEAHLEQLIDRLGQSSTIVIQTVLPRADARAEVADVNAMIRDLAARRGLQVLDLNAAFDDGTGALRSDETDDGLHLTVEGYRRWASELEPLLEELT